METLKRDWDSKLTLRDVLITISCLLIQPNPDSALNAEAGALIQEDYEQFARRAELMTGIHASIPTAMQMAAKEAQCRGQEGLEKNAVQADAAHVVEPPARRRRTIAKVRGMRRTDGSPSAPARSREQTRQGQPFVLHRGGDDVFGISTPPQVTRHAHSDTIENMEEGAQENGASHSPKQNSPPQRRSAMTPRRPHGVAVALGELIMEQEEENDTSEEMEAEYPPSPRKSASRSPTKSRRMPNLDSSLDNGRPESSRDAAARAPNITPPNFTNKPLAEDSPLMDVTFESTLSPKKSPRRGLFGTPPVRPSKSPFGDLGKVTPEKRFDGGIAKRRSPSSSERRRDEQQRRVALEEKLWGLCGGDIRRWNRGDFAGEPFGKKAARW